MSTQILFRLFARKNIRTNTFHRHFLRSVWVSKCNFSDFFVTKPTNIHLPTTLSTTSPIEKRGRGIQLQIRAGPLESEKNSAAQRRCQAWFALNIRLLMHRWWMPKNSGKWGAREISKYREMMYGRLAGWQLSGYLNRGGWDPCQANYLQPSPQHFCVTPDQGQIWNTILTWH